MTITSAPGTGIHRTVTVRPGMCGPGSLFVGQLGDWTWETVSAQCDTDVFAARDASGNPTYLAFYYFRVRGGRQLHPGSLTFGDRLSVTSGCYDQGTESVLTLHRIDWADGPDIQRPLDPGEFYERPREGCLYVENFNRWVTRSAAGSNEGLVKSSPPGFRNGGLPQLPTAYSPRTAYREARTAGTFRALDEPGFRLLPDVVEVEYPVDIVRDVNGVGLLYFASYFSMVDKAALALWRRLGRTDRAFLRRVVVDQQMCYLGNADLDSVLTLRARVRVSTSVPGEEIVDVVISDSGRAIAVSTLCTQHEDSAAHNPEGEA